MKQILTLVLITVAAMLSAQNADTLEISYHENYPYAYMEEGKLKGIEIDILNEYVTWLKTRKNTNVVVVYKGTSDFSAFYASVKAGRSNVVGAGSVTRNAEREREVTFSPTYLNNVAVLISSGRIQTARDKTAAEITKIFSNSKGIAVKGSSHFNYLMAMKNNGLPNMAITTVENQKQVLSNIVSDAGNIGYVDVIAYWSFLKTNPGKFIKMHKVFTEQKEELGFIMPTQSKYAASIAEFFENGFGFTATKTYHQILERYLGYEVLQSVEVK